VRFASALFTWRIFSVSTGEMVFETQHWTKWEGKFRGTPQPTGVYVWMLTYVCLEYIKSICASPTGHNSTINWPWRNARSPGNLPSINDSIANGNTNERYTALLNMINTAIIPVIRNTDVIITAACTFSFFNDA